MKAKDAARLSALRMLKAAIMNKGVEKGRDLDDAEVLQVVVDARQAAARLDRAVLRTPAAPISSTRRPLKSPSSSSTCRRRRRPRRSRPPSLEAIAETGASSPKDMGKVMKAVMPRLAGKNADGRAVNEAVRRKLGA